MEEFVTCNICIQQFDSLQFIPKVLECGHTFCSPCLTKVFEENPSCPSCRSEIKEIESSLPINYNTLKAVDFYMSKNLSERDIDTSIDAIRKKCIKGKDILSKYKTQIMSSMEVFDECLAKLEELTMSDRHRVDTVNTKKILNELKKKLKKTVHFTLTDDIKSLVSIRWSCFEDSEKYLTEIYNRVRNKEKVFAVHKILDVIKYGEISSYENKLFFHSLSSSEVPKDSSLISFDELKQCANKKNFYTFIEICCNEKKATRVLIIKMFDKQWSHHFIRLCTGEFGPSYKGTSYGKSGDGSYYQNILEVKNFIVNDRKTNGLIDFDFCNEENNFYNLEVDEIYLHLPNPKGIFEINRARKPVVTTTSAVGKVISPTTLNDCINYDHSPFLKILNCGIILEV